MNEHQAFCDKCGRKIGAVETPRTVYVREKSEGGAAILSFLWAGLGQLYVGRIVRGLLIIAVYTVFAILTIWIFTMSSWEFIYTDGYYDYYELNMYLVEIVLLSIPAFILWIWNIFDAYNQAKIYNSTSRSDGRPPW